MQAPESQYDAASQSSSVAQLVLQAPEAHANGAQVTLDPARHAPLPLQA